MSIIGNAMIAMGAYLLLGAAWTCAIWHHAPKLDDPPPYCDVMCPEFIVVNVLAWPVEAFETVRRWWNR